MNTRIFETRVLFICEQFMNPTSGRFLPAPRAVTQLGNGRVETGWCRLKVVAEAKLLSQPMEFCFRSVVWKLRKEADSGRKCRRKVENTFWFTYQWLHAVDAVTRNKLEYFFFIFTLHSKNLREPSWNQLILAVLQNPSAARKTRNWAVAAGVFFV